MVKTRIMVFQMNQIIRTGIFALLGIIAIIALIMLIVPNKPTPTNQNAYIPGTYSAYIVLHNQPIGVLVTVNESEIIDITLSEMGEIQEVFYPLFRPTIETLSQSIIRYQTTDLETDIHAAVTSRILLDAVNTALSQAIVNNVY